MREQMRTIAKRIVRKDTEKSGSAVVELVLPSTLIGRLNYLCVIHNISEADFYHRAILEAVETVEMFTPESADQDGDFIP